MTDGLRITIALASILFLIYVLVQVRNKKLLLPYSFFWLVIAALGIIAIAVPSAVMNVAYFLGFEAASNFVFFVVLVFALLFILYLSMVISRLTMKVKNVTQELAILKEQANRERGDVGEDK